MADVLLKLRKQGVLFGEAPLRLRYDRKGGSSINAGVPHHLVDHQALGSTPVGLEMNSDRPTDNPYRPASEAASISLGATPRSKWLVVGGGVMGLKIAKDLVARGQDVTIAEAAPTFGGLTSAWQLGDVTWDRFYHVTLLSDTKLRSLLDDLGLGQENRVWWKLRQVSTRVASCSR